MKVYRSTYWDRDMGQLLGWHANKADAQRWVRDMLAGGPSQGPCEVKSIDIPTDKKGLIGWLNSNLQSDNG